MGVLFMVLFMAAVSPAALFLLWVLYRMDGGKRGFFAYVRHF